MVLVCGSVIQSSEEHTRRCKTLDVFINQAIEHFVPHSRSLTRADGDTGVERVAARDAFAQTMRSFYAVDEVKALREVSASEYTEKIASVDKLLQEIFTRGFHAGVQDQRSIIERLQAQSQAQSELIAGLKKRVQYQQVRIEELIDRAGVEVVGVRPPRY